MAKKLDKSWQDWVNENLSRGCDPMEIGGILLKNDFQLPEIRKAMGKKFPEGLGKDKAGTSSNAAEADALHRKYISLLEIQRDLARLNPRAKIVERRDGVSGNEFLEKYYSANRPVILCDLMEFWQAPTKWTPEYLQAACGDETLEAATMRPDFFSRAGSMKLLKDIEIFTEYLKESTGDGIALWPGTKGAVMPLRHETVNLFMAQVRGRRQVKLIPANEIELVYNHSGTLSQVDAANPDYAKFPKFQYANVIDLELAPSEVLFLPVGWWHWSKAPEEGVAVAFSNFLFPNEFRWQ